MLSFQVPFIEVLDLVKNRRVFLKKGYAYITEDDLVLTVLTAYRTHLSHALAVSFNCVYFYGAVKTDYCIIFGKKINRH